MLVLNDFTTSVERALSEIDPKWRDYDGLIVCGTHTPRNMEYMIDEIEKARLEATPFLGICFGFQLATIEFARNVRGIKDATSEEWATEGHFVIKKREKLLVGLHEGESFWSNYYAAYEYPFPEWFFVTPSHPEYQSMLGKPHPLLVKFLDYAKNH